ncbi:hypothetical protein BDZ91DRAFT_714109 [Kalaharituber pfeilii]|nr:hypothetical protein BDZ91DRAFT_714109 [Kalaharituber pfeilii]
MTFMYTFSKLFCTICITLSISLHTLHFHYIQRVSTSTMEVSAAVEVSTSTVTALFFCLIAAASKQALLFLLGRAIDV